MILWYKSGCKSCSRRTCTMSNDRKVESYAAELGQFGDISSGGGGVYRKEISPSLSKRSSALNYGNNYAPTSV